ncbi:Lysyl oxidase [Intoshia linei]|uniref:protein-lysine 6-oxidase n=1 Tax=Intoshia linei TaxID=1819745 RepID=A0A177B942_9BILA|nr:Lysyl oxidase [Intoshia linei]
MCYINLINENKPCSSPNSVASVKCVHNLPDLVMNKTLLQESLILKFVPLYYLQCAMEENCLASTAYAIVQNIKDWRLKYRKLLRFSASFWNFGTADFLPYTDEPEWKWHECHLHYHSIENFAVYYIRDDNGNELAQGHKASFCLEDVKCLPNIRKKYICQGYGKQGISVGCADSYFSNIDCQWVDITDLRPGNYDLVVHVNPDKRVAELNYDNNVVKCSFTYTGTKIRVGGCSFISGRT